MCLHYFVFTQPRSQSPPSRPLDKIHCLQCCQYIRDKLSRSITYLHFDIDDLLLQSQPPDPSCISKEDLSPKAS